MSGSRRRAEIGHRRDMEFLGRKRNRDAHFLESLLDLREQAVAYAAGKARLGDVDVKYKDLGKVAEIVHDRRWDRVAEDVGILARHVQEHLRHTVRVVSVGDLQTNG